MPLPHFFCPKLSSLFGGSVVMEKAFHKSNGGAAEHEAEKENLN